MSKLRVAVDVARLLGWAAIIAACIVIIMYGPGVARRYVEGPAAAGGTAGEGGLPAATSAATTFPVPDFAAVALTAASLVVAALALVLAIAGVIGYYKIREAAEAKAAEVAAAKAADIAAPVGARSAVAAAVVTSDEADIGDAIAAAQDKGGQDAGSR